MSEKKILICKDHVVSKKEFELVKDEELQMLATSPQPTSEELSKYYESKNYVSHNDSKKGVINIIYHLVKQYALQKKIKLIEQYSEKGELLDIGAGTGAFLRVAKKKGWSINGVEPNSLARLYALKRNVKLLDNINAIDENKQFDVITLWHVLEHIPDVTEYILKLKSLLKENGLLVIAVPNFESYDAEYYREFWAAYDVPRHLWHFSQTSIQKLFHNIGMKVETVKPMKFDSYYVSLLSEKYKTGKTNYLKAFYIGFKSNIKAKTSGNYSSLIYFIKKSK